MKGVAAKASAIIGWPVTKTGCIGRESTTRRPGHVGVKTTSASLVRTVNPLRYTTEVF
jgi:hypothetical protein